MEEFFQEPRLNNLFVYFAEEIIARGHQTCENRKLNNKVADAVPDLEVVHSKYRDEVEKLCSIAD